MNIADQLKEMEWEHPDNYGGHSPEGHYCVYSRNRDSTILENCNYQAILHELKELDYEVNAKNDFKTQESPKVYDFRARHWACGWVEYIIVERDAHNAVLERACEILSALADYPVYDEEEYSNKQNEEIHDYWLRMSLKERIEWCADVGTSIFSARHEAIEENVYDELSQHEMFY